METNLKDAILVLVTSNHGANTGGEEYNRRWHYVYLDGEEVLAYKPGRTSCEPFREYNTQSNGIYGSRVKTDAQWQSFSNWCPGDIIDNRVIAFDYLPAGKHTFKIEVPDAVFKGKDGNFPLSAFILGKKTDEVSIDYCIANSELNIYPNPVVDVLHLDIYDNTINEITLFNLTGQTMYKSQGVNEIDFSGYPAGMYTLVVKMDSGSVYSGKLIKQ